MNNGRTANAHNFQYECKRKQNNTKYKYFHNFYSFIAYYLALAYYLQMDKIKNRRLKRHKEGKIIIVDNII